MTEKHRFLLEEWKINISERMQSGRSITEWCRENNVSKYKYYYWLRELQKESIAEAIKSLPEPVHKETPTFVEITKPETYSIGNRINAEGVSPSAVIRKGQLQIELFSDAASDMVKEIMRAVSDV